MSHYYDLDAILAEEERLPVTFAAGCSGLGRELDPNCDTPDLPRNAAVEMPLWLFPELHERNMVIPKMPKHFGKRTRDDLVAEPAAARLREKCPYWFDVGLALAAQCAGEAPFVGLAAMVSRAFLGRYKALLARAHTAVDSEDKLSFLRLLTREERHVFNAGRQSMLAFQAWKYNTEERMEAAPIVRALRRQRSTGEFLGMDA